MRQLIFLVCCLILSQVSLSQKSQDLPTNNTDTFYGKLVNDPWRRLEDTGDLQVKSWMKNEARKADSFFSAFPGRKKLFDQVSAAIADYKIDEIYQTRYYGGNFYVTRREPGDENFKLYKVDRKGNQEVFIDAEKLHPEISSKNIMVSGFDFNRRGSWMIYGLTIGGNEMEPKMVLRNLNTGKEWLDTMYLKPGYAIVSFDPERTDAFYYRKYPKYKRPGVSPLNWHDSATTHYHIIGSDPKSDELIIPMDSAVIKLGVADRQILWLEAELPYVYLVTKNKVANEYKIYSVSKKEFKGISTKWKLITDYADKINNYSMHGHFLYLQTNKNASNNRVIRIDMRNPSLAAAEEIVAHSKKILQGVSSTKNELLVPLLDDGQGKILRIPHGSKKADTLLTPVKGHVSISWSDRREPFFTAVVTSWTSPPLYYDYDPATKNFKPGVVQKYFPQDADLLESKTVLVTSHDGTQVPLTIIHKKNLQPNANSPVHIIGYGSYGMIDQPQFWPEEMIYYNNGGIKAVAHVRGGGIYGEDWHLDGQKATKQNTWKDMIACAGYLVQNNYGSSKTLVAFGLSAGGITVGRAVTERPDLFAGAYILVGLLDMVRFETSPNGKGNIPEFGSVKTEAGFNALYKMSTYHHIENGIRYPAIVLDHGLNDTRVPVWASMKAAARFQEATASKNPVLLKLDYDSGHGLQNPMMSVINNTVNFYSFIFWVAALPGFELPAPKSF